MSATAILASSLAATATLRGPSPRTPMLTSDGSPVVRAVPATCCTVVPARTCAGVIPDAVPARRIESSARTSSRRLVRLLDRVCTRAPPGAIGSPR
jgi:hypothetical protein